MAQQVFKIDNVDYTGYLAVDGLQWSRNDIDASDAGRDKSGNMRRRRVASKAKLQLTCRTLRHSELVALNSALYPTTVNITYLDPRLGLRTAAFYGSSVSSTTAIACDGETMWKGATFNLIEV